VLGWIKLRRAGTAAAVGEAHDHAQITPALRREIAVTIRRSPSSGM
jgi:hypothetical protein